MRLGLHQAKTAAKLENMPKEPKFQLEGSQHCAVLNHLPWQKEKPTLEIVTGRMSYSHLVCAGCLVRRHACKRASPSVDRSAHFLIIDYKSKNLVDQKLMGTMKSCAMTLW